MARSGPTLGRVGRFRFHLIPRDERFFEMFRRTKT
jgi:hypothetical protein